MLWKIYFWIVVLFCLISIPFYITILRVWEFIDVSLMIIAMIGLFRFAWKKKILKNRFWKVFFFIWVIWTPIYHFGIPLPAEVVNSFAIPQWLIAVLTLIPAIPQFIAVYYYAFSNMDEDKVIID